jgi:hypothetical protein
MVAAMILDTERSRVRSVLVNSGRYSFEEAERKLAGSKLSLFLDDESGLTPAGQAAFLTATVTATRCFGEVSVHGRLDVPLTVPAPIAARTLAEAATIFGARTTAAPLPDRTVLIGPASVSASTWSVQAYWNGWIAGIGPGHERVMPGRGDCVLAGVAAGALAVGQAFLAEQGDPRAGRTMQNLSLWSPESSNTGTEDAGPEAFFLPLEFWLIGLGNLGQSYLWALTMLEYPAPENVLLFLQDDDLVQEANWGTSILVRRGRYDVLKTRVAEEWVEHRGFQARRVDRRLDEHLRRTDREPALALAGLDRMAPRRVLGRPGFEYIIDAGLGATVADYQKFRVNVFDRTSDPAAHFAGVDDETESVVKGLMELPAYRELALSDGDGGCGAAILAERSVAVPFVSACVGALVVTQAIRIASGEAHHVVSTGSVGDVRTIRAAVGQRPGRVNLASVPTGSQGPRADGSASVASTGR